MTDQREAALGGRASPLTSSAYRDTRIFVFFFVQIAGVTLAQKFALPIGDDLGVSFCLPLMAVGVVVLLAAGDATIPIDRAFGFAAFASAALASQTLVEPAFSLAGLFLFLVICSFWMIRIKISSSSYKKLLLMFQYVMVLSCLIAIFQNIWQYIFGWSDYFNVELFVPSWILFPGFVYLQPLYYGSPIMKPAGLFLEVSFLSQAIAVALVIEVTLFGSVRRLCLLSLGIVSTYAGTGPLTLLLVLPLLLRRLSRKFTIAALVLLAIIFVIATLSGSLDAVFSRVDEFASPNTSASQRFIRPLEVFPSYLEDKTWLITGIGAGNIEKAPNVVWWAINKVFREYGFVVTALYYLYFLIALFAGNLNKILAFTLFIVFNFMGGYVSNPPMALLLMLLGTLLRVAEEPEPAFYASIRFDKNDHPLGRPQP